MTYPGPPPDLTRRTHDQYIIWCSDHGIEPSVATEEEVVTSRHDLLLHYARRTCAVRLAADRWLYKAAQRPSIWADNPAAMVKAPEDRTNRAEAISVALKHNLVS